MVDVMSKDALIDHYSDIVGNQLSGIGFTDLNTNAPPPKYFVMAQTCFLNQCPHHGGCNVQRCVNWPLQWYSWKSIKWYRIHRFEYKCPPPPPPPPPKYFVMAQTCFLNQCPHHGGCNVQRCVNWPLQWYSWKSIKWYRIHRFEYKCPPPPPPPPPPNTHTLTSMDWLYPSK